MRSAVPVTLLASIGFLSAAQKPTASLQDELAGYERHFFEAWQQKSLKPFEEQIAADGIAWGEFGLFDKATQLSNQKSAEANCEVRSFKLSGFRVVQVSKDAAFIFYTADQDALCGGQPVPTPMSNCSLYVKRKGRWQNVYRSGTQAKTLPR